MSEIPDRLSAALAERYTIERKLGEGGMATVHLAKDLKHDRQVALKVLKPELARAIGSGRFLREIKITAGLSHPHILPLLDSGEADDILCYVMLIAWRCSSVSWQAIHCTIRYAMNPVFRRCSLGYTDNERTQLV